MIQLLPLKVLELMYCPLPIVDGEHHDDSKNGTAVNIIKEIVSKSTPALETVTFIDCLAIKAYTETNPSEYENTFDQVIRSITEYKESCYEADLPLKIMNFTFTLTLWDTNNEYIPQLHSFYDFAPGAPVAALENIQSIWLPLKEVLYPAEVNLGFIRISRTEYLYPQFFTKAIENIHQRLR